MPLLWLDIPKISEEFVKDSESDNWMRTTSIVCYGWECSENFVVTPQNYLFLSFNFLLFSYLHFAFLVSTIFWTFLYYTNPPSERANITSVSFAYTVNNSEAALRRLRAESPPESPACSSWTRVYILETLQFYHTEILLYINFAADRF